MLSEDGSYCRLIEKTVVLILVLVEHALGESIMCRAINNGVS